eukprot:6107489-Pleurochrysis_carterae.AAC.2
MSTTLVNREISGQPTAGRRRHCALSLTCGCVASVFGCALAPKSSVRLSWGHSAEALVTGSPLPLAGSSRPSLRSGTLSPGGSALYREELTAPRMSQLDAASSHAARRARRQRCISTLGLVMQLRSSSSSSSRARLFSRYTSWRECSLRRSSTLHFSSQTFEPRHVEVIVAPCVFESDVADPCLGAARAR